MGTIIPLWPKFRSSSPGNEKRNSHPYAPQLKGRLSAKGDFTRALSIIDRILLLAPDVAVEVRDRGAVQQRLGRMQGAVQDFKKYLQLAPNAEDAANIRALIQRSVAQLN